MKLENCGRCGLEAKTWLSVGDSFIIPENQEHDTACCPVHYTDSTPIERWDAAQFAARTERINHLADRIIASMCGPKEYGEFNDGRGQIWSDHHVPDFDAVVHHASKAIDAKDAATRARWAKMQGEA